MNKTRFAVLMGHCCVRSHVAEFESRSTLNTEEKFRATVYCLLDGKSYDEQCSIFIEKFSRYTSTNWIALKKIDTCVRYEFRKTYTCQLASKNKKTYGKADENTARDKECQARLDLKWKLVNKSTIRNDPNLSTGLNCIVKIEFDHSHSLTTIEALHHLRSSKETDDKFKTYFQLGLLPADAKNYHEISLMDSVVNEELVQIQLTNPQINPRLRHIIHMYTFWKKHQEPQEEYNYAKLTKLTEIWEKNGTHLTVDKDTLITAIVTPLMARVFNEFSQREDQLTVWIENTDYLSAKYFGNRTLFVTLFFVSSKVGALPIGSVVHNAYNTKIAYKILKETLEKCTGKTFSPAVIISGDDINQRIAQQLVFPDAKHILSVTKTWQGLWKWLGLGKRGYSKEVKRSIMLRMQKVIFSQTIDSATEEFKSMCSSVKEHHLLLKHLEFLWYRRNEWCVPFRRNLTESATNFHDCENSIRVLKDTLLQRCKSFNPGALVNVICHFLEKYNKERLEETYREYIPPHYSKFMKKISLENEVVKAGEFEYQCKTGNCDSYCTTWTDLAVCDCTTGRNGRFCTHLCTLYSELSFWTKTSKITPEDRAVYIDLISGLKNNDDALKTVDEIMDFEFVKAEPLEIDDFEIPPMPDDDEGNNITEDTPMECESSSEDDDDDYECDEKDEDYKPEDNKPEDYKIVPEEIHINDVHVTAIPNFFEEENDAVPDFTLPEITLPAYEVSTTNLTETDTVLDISDVPECDTVLDIGDITETDPLLDIRDVPETDTVLENKDLTQTDAVQDTSNLPVTDSVMDADSDEDEPELTANENPVASPSGNVHGSPISWTGVTIASIRERFDQIVDLLAMSHMSTRKLMMFKNVLDEITTADGAKALCNEITALKKLKRLGFKLPTQKEQILIAQEKLKKGYPKKKSV